MTIRKSAPKSPAKAGNKLNSSMSIFNRFKAIAAITEKDLASRGKGRPKHNTVGQIESSRLGAWALAVFIEMHKLGNIRGAQAKAIANVAKKEPNYSPALDLSIQRRIKQAVKLRKDLKGAAFFIAEQKSIATELQRRMLGFPDDVRRLCGGWTANEFLILLRQENIDGTCPPEWINAIRATSD